MISETQHVCQLGEQINPQLGATTTAATTVTSTAATTAATTENLLNGTMTSSIKYNVVPNTDQAKYTTNSGSPSNSGYLNGALAISLVSVLLTPVLLL